MFHWVKRSSASEQRSSVEFLLIVLEAVLTSCFLQTCCGETWAVLPACCEQLVYVSSLVSLDCFYCYEPIGNIRERCPWYLGSALWFSVSYRLKLKLKVIAYVMQCPSGRSSVHC